MSTREKHAPRAAARAKVQLNTKFGFAMRTIPAAQLLDTARL
jgi:hypothetical protein